MATNPDDIDLNKQFRELLASMSNRLGKSPDEILDEALSRYGDSQLDKNGNGKSLFDALDELGLIGCADGLPADLSTNPDHMEGFGKHH